MSALELDKARPVRPGEELPVDRLAAWLRERVPGLGGQLWVEQFPGGHSNLTYLLRFGGTEKTAGAEEKSETEQTGANRESTVRELVLRRPPAGSTVKTAHDMGREYRVLSRLGAVYPPAPRALAACDDAEILGAPFYVMERVRGVILRHQRLPGGVELPAATLRHLSTAAVDALAELHAVDFVAAGLAELGHPEGYVERQVRGWSQRWLAARTDEVPEVDRTAAWLAEQLPGAIRHRRVAALVHNDFKYDNIVFAGDLDRIVAVLDWEMATIGDPLMDLGTSLAYWMDPDDEEALRGLPSGPTTLPGNLRRAEVAERYAAHSGREVSEILFYYVFGLLKIAVIAQQIYSRYRRGLTGDERFARLLDGVRVLGRTAARAIALRRIDRLAD